MGAFILKFTGIYIKCLIYTYNRPLSNHYACSCFTYPLAFKIWEVFPWFFLLFLEAGVRLYSSFSFSLRSILVINYVQCLKLNKKFWKPRFTGSVFPDLAYPWVFSNSISKLLEFYRSLNIKQHTLREIAIVICQFFVDILLFDEIPNVDLLRLLELILLFFLNIFLDDSFNFTRRHVFLDFLRQFVENALMFDCNSK